MAPKRLNHAINPTMGRRAGTLPVSAPRPRRRPLTLGRTGVLVFVDISIDAA
jgi:hypothetical protein